jgi:hypothetical protein
MEGYFITLPKPKRNTIPTPYCDNILDHDTSEGIIGTHQYFVEYNFIPSMWPILQYPHVHIPTILHWSIYEFENVFPLYLMFT